MIYNFSIYDNEHWWGGTTIHAYCPLGADSSYHKDFRVDAPNQTMPFFLSDKGRYIWSEDPFEIYIENGTITVDGNNVIITQSGTTLREAYLDAQEKHFPCNGKVLPEEFFAGAQYNGWIEFAYYPTQEGVLKYAHEIIENGYEPGVLIIDEGWHQHTAYGKWEFDFARFPDPKAMVNELHGLGFTVMLWIVPFVACAGPDYFRSLHPLIGTDPESAKHIYKRTENNDVAVMTWWNGCSAILDMTNGYDRDFLDRQLEHLMNDYGVDGFKFDGGALSAYCDDKVINGNYAKNSTQVECNIAWNEFGCKYKFHEYKDTFKGGGKNSIQRLHDRDHSWTGNGINELIPCAVNAGLIGHPFICPDMVGGGEWLNRYTPGFEVDEQLFVRMAQCSALFPMIQFSWAPWEALSEEYRKYCLDAALLHKKFAPEIIELVKQSEKTGEPIIRNLEYNCPGKGYWNIQDEFMLGTDILVAPVVTKDTFSREVTFPDGTWQDEEGNRYDGNRVYEIPAPISKLLRFRKI